MPGASPAASPGLFAVGAWVEELTSRIGVNRAGTDVVSPPAATAGAEVSEEAEREAVAVRPAAAGMAVAGVARTAARAVIVMALAIRRPRRREVAGATERGTNECKGLPSHDGNCLPRPDSAKAARQRGHRRPGPVAEQSRRWSVPGPVPSGLVWRRTDRPRRSGGCRADSGQLSGAGR